MTIKDIAKLAGVNHSTVSRALNDSPLISEKTKKKILEIAKDNNFEFNNGARSLSTRKTGIIGVIYQAGFDIFGSSLYTNQLFLELKYALQRTGYDGIFVSSPEESRNSDSHIQRLWRQQRVDGFIIIDSKGKKSDLEFMKKQSIPAVFLHCQPLKAYESFFDIVLTDNYEGGRLAAEHLVAKGCKDLIVIADPYHTKDGGESWNRKMGFFDYLKEEDLPEPHLFEGTYQFESGYNLAKNEWATIQKADGIFAHGDVIAFGFLLGLKERGVRVPEDVRIIGFDDTPLCQQIHPYLSTVHQPKEEICRIACERIRMNIASEVTAKEVFYAKPTLVIDESSI